MLRKNYINRFKKTSALAVWLLFTIMIFGFMNAGTRVVGTSFTINSSSTTDASVVAWVIIEPL